MIAIDATVGGAGTNAYCTLDFANRFHETQLHNSDWFENYVQEELAAALITTARFIDYYEFKGRPVNSTGFQALKWPRSKAVYNGGYVDSTTIPVHVQYANAQVALDYLRKGVGPGDVAEAATSVQGAISSVKAGSVEIKYAGEGATVTTSTDISFLSPEGFRLLRPFLGGNAGGLIRV